MSPDKESGDKKYARAEGSEEPLGQPQLQIDFKSGEAQGMLMDIVFYDNLSSAAKGLLDTRDGRYGGRKDYQKAWDKMLADTEKDMTREQLFSADSQTLGPALNAVKEMILYESARGINLADVKSQRARLEEKIKKVLGEMANKDKKDGKS